MTHNPFTNKRSYKAYLPEILNILILTFFTVGVVFIILWFGAGQSTLTSPNHSFLELFSNRIKTNLARSSLPLAISVVIIAIALWSHSNLYRWHIRITPASFTETIFILLGVWVFAGMSMSEVSAFREEHTQYLERTLIASLLGALFSCLLCIFKRK